MVSRLAPIEITDKKGDISILLTKSAFVLECSESIISIKGRNMTSGNTMRAWVVPEHGGVDVLKLEERPIPEPEGGEVRIRVIEGALNHLDLWVRRGSAGTSVPASDHPDERCGRGSGQAR